MQTTQNITARLVAKGIQSPMQALRAVWSDGTERCSEAAWAALTNGFESLTADQIKQRLAAEGIEITFDAAAELQLDAVVQRPSGVIPVVRLDDEHAISTVDVGDGSGLHSGASFGKTVIVDHEGGAA